MDSSNNGGANNNGTQAKSKQKKKRCNSSSNNSYNNKRKKKKIKHNPNHDVPITTNDNNNNNNNNSHHLHNDDATTNKNPNKIIIHMKSPMTKLITNFHDLASTNLDFAKEWKLLQQRRRHNCQQEQQQQQQQQSSSSSPLQNHSFSSHVNYNFNLSLTRATLQSSFGLTLPSMPPEGKFLCPPVPNRANYVAWVKCLVMQSCSEWYFDLPSSCLETTTTSKKKKKNTCLHYQGIDIGTGASCIYPLLLSTSIFINDDDDEEEEEVLKESSLNQESSSSFCKQSCDSTSKKSLLSDDDDDDNDNNNHHRQWRFAATEIDPESATCAKENVTANKLQDTIHVLLVEPTKRQKDFKVSYGSSSSPPCDVVDGEKTNVDDCSNADEKMNNCNSNAIEEEEEEKKRETTLCNDGPICTAIKATENLDVFQRKWGLPIDSNTKSCFDFVMTNPPFYSTQSDASEPRKGDGRPRTSMTTSESVYPGGEIAFITDMMKDSVLLKNRITWYTSMVGKKSTLMQLMRVLRDEAGFGTASIRTTEFVQGKQQRWGIAWTYRSVAARSLAAKMTGGLQQFEVILVDTDNRKETEHVPNPSPIDEVVDRICSYCKSFKVVSLKCTLQTHSKAQEREEIREKNESSSISNCKVVTISQADYDPDAVKDVDVNASDIHSVTNPFPPGPANLPKEGHFLLDVHVQLENEVMPQQNRINGNDYEDEHENFAKVTVKMDPYSHSLMGAKIIRTIQDQIEGEVGRTNRRWRRILERQGRDKIV